MVGIGGAATADQARLLSHQFDMVAITNPTRRWDCVEGAVAISVVTLVSRIWKACSTRSASAPVKVFLVPITRRAHLAAFSDELMSSSSVMSRSRKAADASVSSFGLKGVDLALAR